jgi:arylformamidase
MREISDITLTISPSLPVWPGDPKVALERFTKMEEGAVANISKMALGVHTGTHVDAPYHFIPGGNTVDTLDLDILVGKAQLVFVDAPGYAIEVDDLRKAGIERGTTRLLLKTRNSEYWDHIENGFQEGFAALSPEASQYLVDLGIKLVGIDYLSIAPFSRGKPTHEVLLKSQMVVVEGLDLRKVQPGKYSLVCLPLKLKDTDGSPARVILISE